MKRRVLAFLLVVAGLALWLAFQRGGLTDETLEVRLGASAPRVRELDLHFERDGATARDLALTFDGAGAPDPLRRTVRLRRGAYQIAVRVVYADRREAHVTRAFTTGAAEPILLDQLR